MNTICKDKFDLAELLNQNITQKEFEHYSLRDEQNKNQIFLNFKLELTVPGIELSQAQTTNQTTTQISQLTLNDIESSMLSQDLSQNQLNEEDLQQLTKPQLINIILQLQKLYRTEKNNFLQSKIQNQQKTIFEPQEKTTQNQLEKQTLKDKFFINLLVNELITTKGKTRLQEILTELSKFKQ